MAEIHFTSHLRNLVTDGPLSAAGATVGEALANVLAAQPHVRSYGSTIAGIYANMSAYSPTASAWRTTAHSHDVSIPTPSSTSCRRSRAADFQG